MALNNTMVILVSSGCVLLLLIFIGSIWAAKRRKKKLSHAEDEEESEFLSLKAIKPIPKATVPIQLKPPSPNTSACWKHIEQEREKDFARDLSCNWKDFMEEAGSRKGHSHIDPLLGVLHHEGPIQKSFSEESLLLQESSSGPLQLDLALLWTPLDESLNLTISNLDNVPVKHASRSSFWILITLNDPTNNTNLKSKKEIQLAHGSSFSFTGVSLTVVERCTLFVELLVRKQKILKESAIGSCSVTLRCLHLVPKKFVTTHLQLESSEPTNRKNISDFGTAGHLLVGLKCRTRTEKFVKVQITIKKSSKLNISMSRREFKVEITLRKCQETLQSFSTSLSHGPSPEWDSAFSLDIPQEHCEESVIDMTVIRSGHLKGIIKVGRASISLSSNRNHGCSQWQEAIKNIDTEILKWHSILFLQDFLRHTKEELKSGIGNLLIALQFIDSRDTCKMKIVIRKLADFEYYKGGGLYKIKITVSLNEDKIESFLTKSVNCNKLVWNEAFVFHLNPLHVRIYNVTVDLLRIGRLRSTTKVGSLTIGCPDNPIGEEHWDECLTHSLMEIDKWYPLHPH